MNNSYLKIRPHHINCIFFYQGLGYDEKFTKHMNNIIFTLRTNPNTKIMLVANCDYICSNCPNKMDDICKSEYHINILDKNTIDIYALKINSFYSFNEIIEKIYKVYNEDKFNMICSTCEWYKQGTCSKDIIESQKNIWSLK